MSSYSKRMLQLASRWLALNPNPNDPFIKVPPNKATEELLKQDHIDLKADELIARAAKEGAPLDHPDLVKLVELTVERQTLRDEIHSAHRDLENVINRPPETGHARSSIADEYLGRWCLKWARHGYNTFELSPDFVAAMLLTDHREVDVATVRLPFHGLLLLIPDGFVQSAEGNHVTKIHITEVSTRDIAQLRVAGKIEDAIGDLTVDQQREVLTTVRNVTLAEAALRPPTAHKLTDELVNTDPIKTDLDHLAIMASDGVHMLHTTIRREHLTWDNLEDVPDLIEHETDREALRVIWRIVFGAFAYVQAVENAVVRRPVQKNQKRTFNPNPQVRYHDVGRTIKLDPKLVTAARAGSREIALQIKHRFIVRGHYRNQVHGVGRADRKRIWIAPFFKGPEDGAMLVHRYTLGDTDAEKL